MNAIDKRQLVINQNSFNSFIFTEKDTESRRSKLHNRQIYKRISYNFGIT